MKKFEAPEIDIKAFMVENIMTTSNPDVDEPSNGDDDMGWG